MATKNASSEFRILSLSGGGYLGLYTAVVLADLEARVGEPLGRRFDLIAGTSVGGLLGLALAYEVPMAQIVKLFVEKGEDIFSARKLPSGAVTRLLDLTRSVLGPKYTGETLRQELTRHLGERSLGDALHAVVIPAVDVSRCATKVFKTPHADTSLGDEDVRAVDVAMATSAAPAYFPSVQIGHTLYADGGRFANNPSLFAPRQLILAHAAVSDPQLGRLRHAERVARALPPLAAPTIGASLLSTGGGSGTARSAPSTRPAARPARRQGSR